MPYKDPEQRKRCRMESMRNARARGKVVPQQHPISSEICKLKWLKKDGDIEQRIPATSAIPPVEI
jgi:hypothetical protein